MADERSPYCAIVRRESALRSAQARTAVLAPFVSFTVALYGVRSTFRHLDGWRTAVDRMVTTLAAAVVLMVTAGCGVALWQLIARRQNGDGAA